VSVPELSLTEERIVLLIAAGRSTREIAADLGFDERAVDWHLARAYRKLEQASTLHKRVSERRRAEVKSEPSI
jgi:DNA-binding CsgD family transcriptional regulator